MPASKKKGGPDLSAFNADTLAELVVEAMGRVNQLAQDLKSEGMTLETERGPIANPKMRILQDEREWIRKAWATKFQDQQGKSNGKREDYYAQGPDQDG